LIAASAAFICTSAGFYRLLTRVPQREVGQQDHQARRVDQNTGGGFQFFHGACSCGVGSGCLGSNGRESLVICEVNQMNAIDSFFEASMQ